MNLPLITQNAIRILTQAEHLITHPMIQANFSRTIGPHLRHIIEHYEALLNAKGVVNYDNRNRDLTVQNNFKIALERIQEVQSCLRAYDEIRLNEALDVQLCVGAAGEFISSSRSSMARELLFVSSHATHHYALIKTYCDSIGISLNDNFGKAPATIAYENSNSLSA